MEQFVDVTGAHLKIKQVKKILGSTAAIEIMKGAQEIYDKADKNLSGGRYLPGTLPVRRITGTGARGLTLTQLEEYMWVIWMNLKIAFYMLYVHDGTKYMKRRPYLENAAMEREFAIRARIQRQILKKVREVGRS